MKRIVLFLILTAMTAGALELGVTLSARGLFALSEPYSFEGVWEQSVEAGVQYGFGFMLNLRLGGGFALGPYVSGLFFTDEILLDDPYSDYDINYDYGWDEFLFGLGVRYDFVDGGSYRPWVRVAAGYTLLELSVAEEQTGERRVEPESGGEHYVETESSGGNYGLEAGLGLDLYMADYFSVGLSCEFRLNGLDLETGEGTMAESATALGAGVNLGFLF